MNATATLWSSRLAFLLSAMGAAVGLGSVWRFPYLMGTHGGAAFLLVFLLACVLVALPLLVAELLIGRSGRGSPPRAMANAAEAAGHSRRWGRVGLLGPLTAFLVLTYYSVISGWSLAYAWYAASGALTGHDATELAARFAALLADPYALAGWHALFMACCALILSTDLAHGIERANKLMMPALFVLLLGLVGYALATGDAARGIDFVLRPDFARIDAGALLAATGQAFFAIGIGMGMMTMYGAYLPQSVSLLRSGLIIAGSVTVVSLLAALAIFPLVFRYGLDPAEGPQLVFVTMPVAFAQMHAGSLVGCAFFLVLAFAALTSAIAALEPVAVRMHEWRGWSRRRSALVMSAAGWLLGLATVLSFNRWQDLHPLAWLPGFATRNTFDILNFVTSDVLPPVSAILIALFAGWRMRRGTLRAEFAETGALFAVWLFLLRWVCPPAVLLILVAGLR